ncbi:hypothetical protein BHE74_00044759 [Ensete ventricosum]|nr:hypothetical protein BHE74_00044759 [Ensete ventricosum]RZS04924.1 hypothetical protein BHM03_00035330 [Ensete ventricosum]
MADAYWRYGDARQQAVAAAMPPPAATLKRPRLDYHDMPSGSDMLGYYVLEDERTVNRAIRDTESLGASYDRYLRDGVFAIPSLPFADIFRPFVGFEEVRLVNKESRQSRLDFAGYRFDENDRKSANLRLQFARFPGPRSFGGPRGRQH